MARATQSRNGFFGFLTDKKVTYQRDVAKERKERKAEAMADRRERLEVQKLRAQEKEAEAKIAAAQRKIDAAKVSIRAAEKKADKGAIAEAQFDAMKSRMEREIEAQKQHQAAARAKMNPSAGFGSGYRIKDERPPFLYKKLESAKKKAQRVADEERRAVTILKQGADGIPVQWFAVGPRTTSRAKTNPGRDIWNAAHTAVARLNYGGFGRGNRWEVSVYSDRGDLFLKRKEFATEAKAEKWARDFLAERDKYATGRRNASAVGERWEYSYRGKKNGVWRNLFATSKITKDNGATVTFADGRTVPSEALVRPVGPRNAGNKKRKSAAASKARVGKKNAQPNPRLRTFADVNKAKEFAKNSGRTKPFYIKIVGWYGKVLMSPDRWGNWWPTETGHRGQKGNPAEDAAALYKSFHGKAPSKVTRIVQQLHEHKHLAEIGDLVRLVIDTPTGLVSVLDFNLTDPKKIVHLASSEKDPKTGEKVGKQLYLRGGDQEVNLKGLKMDSPLWIRDLMELGRLHEFKRGERLIMDARGALRTAEPGEKARADEQEIKGSITYRTRKGFDKFELIDYWHKAGEETEKKYGPAARSLVLYDYRNKKIQFAGGQYAVRPEGIVN